MSDPAIIGPVGMRQFHLDACESHQGHRHNYDHTTVVIRGRLRVHYRLSDLDQWQEAGEFGQAETIAIKAKIEHRLEALEDDTVYICVFSHRDFDGLVIEKYVGNQRAYV